MHAQHEVARAAPSSPEQQEARSILAGSVLRSRRAMMADGRARQFTFVQEAKSVVTYPSPGQRIAGRGFHEISGLAWSGRGRVARVDVSVDGGRNWVAATLQEPILPKCLTRFRLAWNWQGEVAVIMSRAIDESGYVQPSLEQLVAVRGRRSIYHNNAMHTWRVGDDGIVSNVRI